MLIARFYVIKLLYLRPWILSNSLIFQQHPKVIWYNNYLQIEQGTFANLFPLLDLGCAHPPSVICGSLSESPPAAKPSPLTNTIL